MMDFNLILLLVIAIIMAILSFFVKELILELSTGVWDYGYLMAMFLYSVGVGVVAATTGVINLNMPLDQWWPVLTSVGAQYFMLLTFAHTIFDIFIAKFFPTMRQGLATKALKRETRMKLAAVGGYQFVPLAGEKA